MSADILGSIQQYQGKMHKKLRDTRMNMCKG